MSGRRHHRRFRRLAPAIGLLAALVWAPTGQAQAPEPPPPVHQPLTVFSPVPQEKGQWGERSRVAGDLDHDGVNDLWIGVHNYHRGNVPYGRVYAVSGASLVDPQGQKDKPKIIYEIRYPEPQPKKNFGFWIENVGDVDGDDTADLAVGTDAQDVPVDQNGNCEQSSDSSSETCHNTQVCRAGGDPKECNENQGKAWVFSGKTNKVLYDLDNPEPQGSPNNPARFGSRIGRAGDVNGNGVPDVLVGASGNDDPAGCADADPSPPPSQPCRKDEGRAYIFEGRDGELIRTLKLPEEDKVPTPCADFCGDLGLAVQGPGDVDGDKVPDLLVSAPSLQVGPNSAQGRMYVYSGRRNTAVDDRPILKIDDPNPQPGAFFGFQDTSPRNPGDVCQPQDGKADLYGNGFLQAGPAGPGQGRSWVFNGATGSVCYELQNPNPEPGGQFGWSMTRERNLVEPNPNEDNPVTNPIYIGNAPHFLPAPPTDERGQTNTFEASTGSHLETLPLPSPWNTETGESPFATSGDQGPALGWQVASPGDLNGDGLRDFLAGAPFTNVCRIRLGTQNKYLNKNEGVMIVYRSGPPPSGGDENGAPSDKNPADNVCNDDDGQGGPGE